MEIKFCFRKIWVYRCSTKRCRKEFYVLKNTPLFYSKIKISKIVHVVSLFYQSYKLREIKIRTGLSLKTIIRIITTISDYIFIIYIRSLEKNRGKNEIFEVDESVLVKRKYNK
ncbi:hypothetical protein DMUE_1366 [Dictyocoela muelleri]|nr:hypothetical protein DMUE_1366 [Dictyocoela muelleri]